jgi:hypothetical protein
MHEPINIKSPNNTSKWQMGFNSAFKGLREFAAGLFSERSEHSARYQTVFLKHIQIRNRLYRKEIEGIFCVVTNAGCSNRGVYIVVKSEELIVTGFS